MTAEQMAAIYARGFPDSRPWSAEEVHALLADKTTLAVTAEAGFALWRVLPPEAELLTIVVAPEARGHGIGAALLRDGIAQAAARGVARVFLEVEAANTAALSLYARVGFARDGHRKSYYRHRDGSKSDAILMSCALDA